MNTLCARSNTIDMLTCASTLKFLKFWSCTTIDVERLSSLKSYWKSKSVYGTYLTAWVKARHATVHYTHFLTRIFCKHPLSTPQSWLSWNVVSLKAATETNAANAVLLAPIYGYQAIAGSNASLHLIQVNIWSKQHQRLSSALKKCCFLVRGFLVRCSHSKGSFVLLLPVLSTLISLVSDPRTPFTASTIQIRTFVIFQNCSLPNI